MRASDIIQAVGNTPLVEVKNLSPKPEVRIFAKLEGNNPTGSVKDRAAKYMLEQAEARGEIKPDKIILEPTSGNTGIALAMMCRRKGYRLKVVMPDNVSPERRQLLELYGAEIADSPGNKGTNGAIEVAMEMAEDDRYYMPYQYGNPANPQAHYEGTGAEIIRDLPEVTAFVAGLGTGGTLMGVSRRLKEHNPDIQIVAIEPHPGELVQGLRSLEDGFIPPIVDLSMLDSRIVVESRDAFVGTKMLAEKEGIFAGVSSGAIMMCALRYARRLDQGHVVVILPDSGWKYLSSGLWTKDVDELVAEMGDMLWW